MASWGYGTPAVTYDWTDATKTDACGHSVTVANPHYCPSDDTVYISASYAHDLWAGVNTHLPGQNMGIGRGYRGFRCRLSDRA
jgi:hypothetical protein